MREGTSSPRESRELAAVKSGSATRFGMASTLTRVPDLQRLGSEHFKRAAS